MTCGLTDIVNFCLAMGGIFLFTATYGTLLYAIILNVRHMKREDKKWKKIDEEFQREESK